MIDHVFYLDKLNVGGSLETLLYSYVTETPLIIDNPRPPVEIEELEFNLDFLGFRSDERIPAIRVWDRLTFLLSMAGMIMIPNNIETLREEENKIVIVTHNMRKVEVTYQEISWLDKKKTPFSWMYDWFAVRSGGKHDIPLLEDEDFFVNKLIFYPSTRAGVRNKKDVVAVSYLRTDEIYDIEHSEGYVTLKTKNMMKNAGIKGTSKGYSTKGFRRFDPIKLEHIHRETREQTIPDMTLGQILDIPRNEEGELCRMTKNLFRQQMRFTWQG
jgi:energy-coupling factor transporter ATP-binding protein EcfA2